MRGEELASCDTFLKFAEISSSIGLITVVLMLSSFIKYMNVQKTALYRDIEISKEH